MYIIVYPNDPEYKGMDAFYKENTRPSKHLYVTEAPVKLVTNPNDATLYHRKGNAKIRLTTLKKCKIPKGHSKPYIANVAVQNAIQGILNGVIL